MAGHLHGGQTIYDRAESDSATPQFLVIVSPWHKTFFGGLRDLLLGPFRRRTRLLLTSRPAAFWPDVFVERGVPPSSFGKSLVLHLLLVLAVWTCGQNWLVLPPAVEPRNPMQNTVLIYYPISEYLPPIKDLEPSEPAKVAHKGDPVPARQRIVSSPHLPDNSRQTIVTPSPPVIEHEPMLPNFVINSPYLPAVPTSAARDLSPKLTLPPQLLALEPPPLVQAGGKVREFESAEAVPPPPVVERSGRLSRLGQTAVVEPTPNITADARTRAFPTPAVVEPPPSTNHLRSLGAMNLARVGPDGARSLAVAEQQAVPPPPNAGSLAKLPSRGSNAASAAAGPGVGNVVAPAPESKDAATLGGNSARTAGQLIALNVRPALPGLNPLEIPEGNRRGKFAAAPDGSPNALGTPDVSGGGRKNGTGERSAGSDATVPGITVAAGPVNPGTAVVGATAYAVIPAQINKPPSAFAAAIRPPKPADIARETRPDDAPPEVSMEDTIFGRKKYYSMVLNMPNLSSMRGSWVMRFAELRESSLPGDLTAPVAIVKIDPAYSAEMMRTRVEGVVMLYAVIRTDGRVENVRVLRGVESRLDANAVAALSKWLFHPARKNGVAVAAEAVVQIPFQATGTN